jgi:hypothetical protein
MILFRWLLNDQAELLLEMLGTHSKPFFLCQMRKERPAHPSRSITFFLEQQPDLTSIAWPLVHLSDYLVQFEGEDLWEHAQELEKRLQWQGSAWSKVRELILSLPVEE